MDKGWSEINKAVCLITRPWYSLLLQHPVLDTVTGSTMLTCTIINEWNSLESLHGPRWTYSTSPCFISHMSLPRTIHVQFKDTSEESNACESQQLGGLERREDLNMRRTFKYRNYYRHSSTQLCLTVKTQIVGLMEQTSLIFSDSAARFLKLCERKMWHLNTTFFLSGKVKLELNTFICNWAVPGTKKSYKTLSYWSISLFFLTKQTKNTLW